MVNLSFMMLIKFFLFFLKQGQFIALMHNLDVLIVVYTYTKSLLVKFWWQIHFPSQDFKQTVFLCGQLMMS